MTLVEFVPPVPHPLWELCPQMGITDVIVKVNPDLTGLPDPWRYETLKSIVDRLASAGLTVAVSLAVPPTVRSSLSLSSVTELTLTVGFTTVTLQTADLPPADAVMLAEPTATAVTSPEGDTVATDALEVDHVTVLSLASDGETVAESLVLSPTASSTDEGLADTDDTATSTSGGSHASSNKPRDNSAVIRFILLLIISYFCRWERWASTSSLHVVPVMTGGAVGVNGRSGAYLLGAEAEAAVLRLTAS